MRPPYGIVSPEHMMPATNRQEPDNRWPIIWWQLFKCTQENWARGMALKLNITIIDDLDGSPGAEAVFFRFNGQGYEIDLSPANHERMREVLRPFMDAGRQLGRRQPAHAT